MAGLAALVGTRGDRRRRRLPGDVPRQPVLGCRLRRPQLLPEPVGTIGQWLPPGAGATLLRSVAFFDGATATGPVLTLTWWAALGLGAVILGERA